MLNKIGKFKGNSQMQIPYGANDIPVQEIHDNLLQKHGISLSIARLDLLHPVVSGNKLFKLHYFLDEAIKHPSKKIITYGGAYSNHLVAAAFAARETNLGSVGIVRGEQPAILSPTLVECLKYGMKMEYISRDEYKKRSHTFSLDDGVTIPEGGYHPLGAKGAERIMDLIPHADHYCISAGTATTVAGVLSRTSEQVIVFPAIKNMLDINERILYLTGKNYLNLNIENEYHFGGYARYTNELISFMNNFYKDHHVPLDFIYTGKMLYGVLKNISRGKFPKGSKIICIHTGGLQGNRSIASLLNYHV